MASSLLGTIYLCWVLVYSHEIHSNSFFFIIIFLPNFHTFLEKQIGPARSFRIYGTFVSVPFIVLQLLLIGFGKYGMSTRFSRFSRFSQFRFSR